MAERRGCGIDKGPAGHLPGRYLAAGRWSPPGRYPRQGGVPSSSSSLAAPTMTPARAALRLLPTFQKFLPRAPNGPRYARALLIWSRLFRGRIFLHFGSSPYRHHGLTDPPTTRKEHHSPPLARYRIISTRSARQISQQIFALRAGPRLRKVVIVIPTCGNRYISRPNVEKSRQERFAKTLNMSHRSIRIESVEQTISPMVYNPSQEQRKLKCPFRTT